MNRQWARYRYSTTLEDDAQAGSSTLKLHRENGGHKTVAAQIVYWDAVGQYFLETLGVDVPINIIEELIAEAKERIRTS